MKPTVFPFSFSLQTLPLSAAHDAGSAGYLVLVVLPMLVTLDMLMMLMMRIIPCQWFLGDADDVNNASNAPSHGGWWHKSRLSPSLPTLFVLRLNYQGCKWQ